MILIFQEPSEDLISQELINPPEAIREEVVETQPNNPVSADDEKFREINENNDSSSSSNSPSSSSSPSSGSDSEHSEILNPAAESGPDPEVESNAAENGNNPNIISESFAADDEEVPDSQVVVEEEISSNQIAETLIN